MTYYKHYCPQADKIIDYKDDLFQDCNCKIDSYGNPPKFIAGDRVLVKPNNMEATVVVQQLHHDGSESFWGNVQLIYDDGVGGQSNSWQLNKL